MPPTSPTPSIVKEAVVGSGTELICPFRTTVPADMLTLPALMIEPASMSSVAPDVRLTDGADTKTFFRNRSSVALSISHVSEDRLAPENVKLPVQEILSSCGCRTLMFRFPEHEIAVSMCRLARAKVGARGRRASAKRLNMLVPEFEMVDASCAL